MSLLNMKQIKIEGINFLELKETLNHIQKSILHSVKEMKGHFRNVIAKYYNIMFFGKQVSRPWAPVGGKQWTPPQMRNLWLKCKSTQLNN